MVITRAAVAVAAAVALGSGAAVGYVSQAAAGPSEAPSTLVAASDSASPKPADSPSTKPSSSASDPSGMTMKPDAVVSTSRNGVTVESSIKTKNPVFFITIDDGWNQPADAVRYVEETKLPVTSFLTNAAVQGNWSYFKRFSAFDAVQNHSMTHKALSKSSTDLNYEICETQKRYAQHYGVRPWILRPPYGAGFQPVRPNTPDIEKKAASCGIKHITLWNVTVSGSGKIEWAGTPFKRGDIVLLHFEGDLKANLQKVVREYAKHGLRPAPLSKYLAQ